MNFTMPKKMLLLPCAVLACLSGMAVSVSADDTEIFDVTASAAVTGRPKVVILFDDSGSMRNTVEGQRPEYDPAKDDYEGGIEGDEFLRIYWSTNGVAPGAGSNNWFPIAKNRCESSITKLDEEGFFGAGGAKRWVESTTTTRRARFCSTGEELRSRADRRACRRNGGTVGPTIDITEVVPGSWAELSRNERDPAHVECEVDVSNEIAGNGPGQADGFPLDDVADALAFGAATAIESLQPPNNVNWNGSTVTFYSANYVDYWNDDSLAEDRTRLEIAQEVVSNIISANTGIDFGLATFNDNTPDDDTDDPQDGEDGGRIIRGIIDNMSETDRTNLVSMVNGLNHGGWTPLCESAYEVYRYMAGEEVLFGKQRDTSGDPDQDRPARDTTVEDGDNYDSPTSECTFVYLIVMTDGLPTYDDAATEYIEELTGKTCRNWADDLSNNGNPKNCLPELAEYMATNDLDGDADNGEQLGRTYTIGFTTSQLLLAETAALGGGQYFEATSAESLTVAFQSAVLAILSTESTFTSPAVAVDTFTRTESRDDVYYAMFKPDSRVDWRGNIKKLKVKKIDDVLQIVDKNNDAAIDSVSGYILDTADTYWSTDDGGIVEQGGVGELLANRDPADRVIKINTGSGGALEDFNATNLDPDAFGVGSVDELYTAFGVGSQAGLDAVIAYGQGYGIGTDGNSTGTTRDWVLGDPLHSQPLIINYGALGDFDLDAPDLRVVVGTNAGFVHMFGNDDGAEDWAFFPKDYVELLNQRKINAVSTDNVYGMDLTPVALTYDSNADGTLSAADGDKVWLYLGMRRGGRDLYALDVSNPDEPAFLWSKGDFDSGMDELGWTWSHPVVTRIPGYADGNGVAKPVVIIGAGYDTNKDSGGIGTEDSMGRGVFILDAQTGAVIRTISPAAATATNLRHAELVDSVPAQVAVLDGNGDELTDRLYFADTGGSVWRVDIGSTLPGNVGEESWKIIRLATLSGSGAANDRRFFNKVDIARIRTDDGPVDALLIGTGDRANPLAIDVTNYFYMIRDEQTGPYITDRPTSAECTDTDNPITDFRCSLPLDPGDLYDITDDLLSTETDEDDLAVLKANLREAGGWLLRLTAVGEKNLSDSLTTAGKVAFTTFTPDGVLVSIDACSDGRAGQGKLYLVDIYDGGRDIIQLGPIIPDTPSLIVRDGEISFVLPPGTPPSDRDPDDPPDCRNGICNLLESFPTPFGNYWYREEY